MRKVLLFLVLLVGFTACNKRSRMAKIKSYRVHNTATADPNDWLYYYVMTSGNNNYYYYTSTTPVTDFSTASWVTSTSLPSEIVNESPFSEISEPLSELPNEIEVEMNEGFDTTEGAGESSSDSDSDSGGDSGGGDSGGGGDGGGD